jgi:hydrogenase nickel incorporation protein HypB
MCDTCGCGKPGEGFRMIKPGEERNAEHLHTHSHDHDHTHEHEHSHDGHTHSHIHAHSHETGEAGHDHQHKHDHTHTGERQIAIEQDVLGRNNLLAERNRGFFEARAIIALNLVSSPGSGKTSVLERTIREHGKARAVSVIEGDQQTTNDAMRIKETGASVIQINTGNGCHLDAEMVNSAVKELNVPDKSILFIENVGNLVCPALFDLGEAKRVVIISVTEGEDKPLKYPNMFQTAQLCLINKTDLLPYLDFSVEELRKNATLINPTIEFIELSAKTGDGFEDWYRWLDQL